MSQRLTRKEIKRDQVQEALAAVMEFLGDNFRSLLAVAGLVLLLVAAMAAFWSYREHREIEASEQLAQAVRTYSENTTIDADPAAAPTYGDSVNRDAEARSQFELVLSDYPSSDAAAVAKAYLGEMAARSGDLDGARQLWQEFLETQGRHMLASEIRLNLMSLDRAQGRGQELVTQIKAMLEESESDLPKDVLLHELALTQRELGLEPDARQTFQRLLDEYPRSVYAADAQAELGTAASGNSLAGF
jgi:tetratricopeptide (TPR) repeat protein